MAELINKFSWSFSAAEDFEECRRKRYWSKYASWKGWDAKASEVQRKAYRLNKMENRFTLQGRAVELAVRWVLRQTQQGQTVTLEQAYEQIARPFLNQAWKESKEKLWQGDPKNRRCLHEHYYPELHTKPEKEWIAALTEQVKRCIANFVAQVLPRLAGIRPDQEVAIADPEKAGDPESFELEGLKVYAIPDYVYHVEDQWHIHDWKSGRPKLEHQDQLAVYGLWANLKHQVPPEDILVYLEYLNEGVVACEPVTSEMLENIKEKIRVSVADMADYLEGGDRKRNLPLPREDWDLAPTRQPCRSCKFYELCKPEFEPEE